MIHTQVLHGPAQQINPIRKWSGAAYMVLQADTNTYDEQLAINMYTRKGQRC
jgi:hypothetical protein